MKLDNDVLRTLLRDAIARSGSRFNRISLCRRGAEPFTIPENVASSGFALWDGVLSFLSGEDSSVLLPRGGALVLATLAPDVVLVAELQRVSQIGVGGVLLRELVDKILSSGVVAR